jgi:hypothetical protein
MNKNILVLTASAFCTCVLSAMAQPGMGGPPAGPKLGPDMAKILGENTAFSANLEFVTTPPRGGTMTMPGKIAYLEGKSRFEMDMGKVQGGNVPPNQAAQMKQMGMDQIITISRYDKKVVEIIMPSLKGYYEQPLTDAASTKAPADFKADITELGKETLDGHPCVKNKYSITSPEGGVQTSTVWNATDLNRFPIKIEVNEPSGKVVMHFTDIVTARPDAALFEPPSDLKKYDNMMSLIMSKMGGMQMPMGGRQ